MALAALVAGLALSGFGRQASAAGAGSRPNPRSEAALGAARHQPRQSGCALIVPARPLTAQGLASPYQLTSLNGGACHEAVSTEAAFVQAAALDPATGQITIYDPLVIDKGAQPAIAPVTPTLPANAVVAIWFGSNATGLHLRGARADTLDNGRCVNGLGASIFGQVAYCNAPAFFRVANQLIRSGKLTPPALGTGRDQLTCPTVRDFSVVDQDQSDNVTTTYLVAQDGSLAQNTSANAAALPQSSVLGNGSDNGLLAVALDGALGCSPWQAPDLANGGQLTTALPLDELQAAHAQAQPVALTPSGDPMVLVNGHPNLDKQNLYRAGMDQPAVESEWRARVQELGYCRDLLRVAPARLQLDRPWTSAAPTLDPAVGNSLYTFLAARYAFTIGPSGLNCLATLHQPSPVQLTLDSNGVAVDATFTTTAQQGSQSGADATAGVGA